MTQIAAPVQQDYAWMRVKTCVRAGRGDKQWWDVTFEGDERKCYSRREKDYLIGSVYPIHIEEHKMKLPQGEKTTYECIDIKMTPEVIATKPQEGQAAPVQAPAEPAKAAAPPAEKPLPPHKTEPPPSMREPGKAFDQHERTEKPVTIPDNQPRKGVVKLMRALPAETFKPEGGDTQYKWLVTMEDGFVGVAWVPGESDKQPFIPGQTINYTIGKIYKDGSKRIDMAPEGSAVDKETAYIRLQCLQAAVAYAAIPGAMDNEKGMKMNPTMITIIAKAFEKHITRNDEQPSTTQAQ